MSDRDYYEILGLTPRADGAMVDQAYWHLARKYQALAATNARAQRLLDELNEAYGVLGNPRLREQYDAFRDDVLIRQGMIKPVASKAQKTKAAPAPKKEHEGQPPAAARRRLSLPAVAPENRRTYLVASIIAILGMAGAWQGVNIVFLAVALSCGLALALLPTIRSRVTDANLSLPAIHAPKLSMPDLSEINVPALRDLGIGQKEDGIDADELRSSTAATIARWRQSLGLKAAQTAADGEPDSTLVDIVESERKLDDQDEPLAAVIDILRGANKTVETH